MMVGINLYHLQYESETLVFTLFYRSPYWLTMIDLASSQNHETTAAQWSMGNGRFLCYITGHYINIYGCLVFEYYQWAMSGWGIYKNPAPAAQWLYVIFWDAMASTNMLIGYHSRNIKVRFTTSLGWEPGLDCGTIVDGRFRRGQTSMHKLIFPVHDPA